MEIKSMSIDELMTRKDEIRSLADTCEVKEDLENLLEEVRSINAELEERKENAKAEAELRSEISKGLGEVIEERKEDPVMDNKELRASQEYLNAFVDAIKGDDRELRTLISANASGGVPVPTYMDEAIATNWNKLSLFDGVTRTYIKGNLGISFELSNSGASIHTEGGDAPAEETLTFGVVSLIPQSLKKWIRITDEVMDLRGEAFLDFIVDEITYEIAKLAQATAVGMIASLPQSATSTSVSANIVKADPSVTVIATAMANLSDEAMNPVIIMNRLTYAKFIEAKAQGNFDQDPFYGLPVIFENSLDDFDTASANEVYAIVGDRRAIHLNFPNGQDINIKVDAMSEAEADLVKIVGRQYVGIGIVRDKHFALITKE